MAAVKYSELTGAFIIGIMLGAFLFSGNIGARKNLNINPPVSILKDSDINAQNMNLILKWTSDNFAVLYNIAKVQRGDTLFIIGD